MKNKLAKSMTMIIAIAMLVSMVPVMATGTLDGFTVTPNADYTKITVTPDANSGVTEYTLLAVRADSALTVTGATNSLESLSDSALENQIEYIDQPLTSNGAVEFTLRDRGATATEAVQNVTGRTITVFLGAADASAIAKTVVIPLAAPTVEVDDALYIDGVTTDFITVTDGEGWLDGASLAIYTMVDSVETEVGAIEDGEISFIDDYPTNEEATYTIKGKDVPAEGYAAFTPVEFTAISKFGAAAAKLPASISVVTDETTATITIPADVEADPANDYYGCAVTFEYVTDPAEQGTFDNGTLTITRPSVVDETIKVTVTAKIDGTVAKTYSEITVLDTSKNGPTFEASNVEVIGTDVYKMTGKSVVIVKHGEVDGETTSIVVDGVKLYYFPVRGTHVGVIDTTTVDELISGNKITTVSEAPAKLYSGVAMESDGRVKPTGNDGSIAARYGANLTPITPELSAIGWKLLGTSEESKAAGYDETAWLLSCDVVGALDFATGEFAPEMDGKVVSNDAMFIRRVGANKDSKFAIDPDAQ